MKTKSILTIRFLFAGFLLSNIVLVSAQAVSKPTAEDTNSIKRKKFDYSFLNNHPEAETGIFGKVNKTTKPLRTELYPKGDLFGDTPVIVNTGAVIEVMSTTLPLSYTNHRALVKVISDPITKENAGKKGWLLIDHTTLLQFLDEEGRKIDTNFVRAKYVRGATQAREAAAKTTCPENKKCYLEWADYYDCAAKNPHYDAPVNCALVKCSMVDCPGDTK